MDFQGRFTFHRSGELNLLQWGTGINGSQYHSNMIDEFPIAAGTIEIVAGVPTVMNNHTGHFANNPIRLELVRDYLSRFNFHPRNDTISGQFTTSLQNETLHPRNYLKANTPGTKNLKTYYHELKSFIKSSKGGALTWASKWTKDPDPLKINSSLTNLEIQQINQRERMIVDHALDYARVYRQRLQEYQNMERFRELPFAEGHFAIP